METPEPTSDLEVGRYALRSFKLEPLWHGSWGSAVQTLEWGSLSYGQGGNWGDGTCTAVCNAGNTRRRMGLDSHVAPDENCTCGIYGSLSYADLIAQYRSESRLIVTVIAAEGITIIGTRGLRTQFARVVAYWVVPIQTYCETAATQFKDAVIFDNPADMIDEYGLRYLPPTAAEGKRAGGGNPRWWTGEKP